MSRTIASTLSTRGPRDQSDDHPDRLVSVRFDVRSVERCRDARTLGDDPTEAFSDGVFAFAITLLVLDINVSESELDHLWRGIAH